MLSSEIDDAVSRMSRPDDFEFMPQTERAAWLRVAKVRCIREEVHERERAVKLCQTMVEWHTERITTKDQVYSPTSDWSDEIKHDYVSRERPRLVEGLQYEKQRLCESALRLADVVKHLELVTGSNMQRQQQQRKRQTQKTVPGKVIVLLN